MKMSEADLLFWRSQIDPILHSSGDDAPASLRDTLRQAPSDTVRDLIQLELGSILQSRGESKAAAAEYLEIAGRSSSLTHGAMLAAVNCYVTVNLESEASQICLQLVEIAPSTVESLRAIESIRDMARRAGNPVLYKEMKRLMLSGLELNSGEECASILAIRAGDLIDDGRYADAIPLLEGELELERLAGGDPEDLAFLEAYILRVRSWASS